MTHISSINLGWIHDMADTVIFDSGIEWSTVWISSLVHWNEPFPADVLNDFHEKIRNRDLALNKWKLIAILKWNSLAHTFWQRFSQDDLNRVVNWVPMDERRDNYEQRRGAEIKALIDRMWPQDWLDLHSFSAPNGLPYAFSSLHWYYNRGSQLWIWNMAVNMANANKKADGGQLLWRGVADYVNDIWANWFTFEAWNHTDPQCYVNSYQALINFLVSLDMLSPKKVEVHDGSTFLLEDSDIVKIWWNESSHVHIEEKHIFTGWFRYASEHPQSFRKYAAGELIGYDIIDGTETSVLAPFNGYIIMPKDPEVCILWKEVFYYWKNMSEVGA